MVRTSLKIKPTICHIPLSLSLSLQSRLLHRHRSFILSSLLTGTNTGGEVDTGGGVETAGGGVTIVSSVGKGVTGAAIGA